MSWFPLGSFNFPVFPIVRHPVSELDGRTAEKMTAFGQEKWGNFESKISWQTCIVFLGRISAKIILRTFFGSGESDADAIVFFEESNSAGFVAPNERDENYFIFLPLEAVHWSYFQSVQTLDFISQLEGNKSKISLHKTGSD